MTIDTFLVCLERRAVDTGWGGHHPSGHRQMNLERHRIEVVATAATGDPARAAGLFREHLADVACDPLASRIAAHHRQSTPVTSDPLPGCHPAAWPC